MDPRPLPAGVRPFALGQLPSEPWRNGAGWTRTVAAALVGERLRWRVSAADITRAGPFSVFDGMDRTAVLMHGPGLTLQGPQEQWVLEGAGAVARFPGEVPLQATPGPAGVARLWNVMVDRASLRADVHVHRAPAGQLEALRAGVLVVLDGRVDVLLEDTPLLTLGPDDGLLLANQALPLALHVSEGLAHWVMTRFLPA